MNAQELHREPAPRPPEVDRVPLSHERETPPAYPSFKAEETFSPDPMRGTDRYRLATPLLLPR